jgi:plastocyanin
VYPTSDNNMKLYDVFFSCSLLRFLGICTCLSVAATPATAVTTTNVTIGDDFFSPSTVKINPGDSVKWNWNGAQFHSSSSSGTPALWDSGTHTTGFTFTHTFANAGSFPYHCNVHSFQLGTVTVQAQTNVPPSIAVTGPTNGATFAAPWSGPILATVSDTDDTISTVAFLAGATVLGTMTNPPASISFNVPNLGAGTYVIKAVATDSRGATNTSATLTVQIVAPAAIVLGQPQRLSPTSFQFTYSADPGLSYIVRRAGNLPDWVPIATNTATTSSVSFVDDKATNSVNSYSIQLVPNP